MLFLQLTLLGKIEINTISPDWSLLVVIFASLYLPVSQAIVTNWFIGIFKDITSFAGFGSFGFLFILTTLVIYVLKEIIVREDFTAQLVITFTATYFCHFLYGLGLVIAYGTISLSFVLSKAFFITLATSLVAAFIFGLQFRVKQMFIQREEQEIREMMKRGA